MPKNSKQIRELKKPPELKLFNYKTKAEKLKDELSDSGYESDYSDESGVYKKGKELGKGAFGIVHEFIHINNKDKTVVKTVLRKDQKPDAFKKHIDKEVRLTNLLYSNCRVHYTKDDTMAKIVMPHLQGVTLQDFLKETSEIKTILAVLINTLTALELVHKKNIVHGDFSTKNVIVDLKNDTAYLLDFGVSRLVGEDTWKISYGRFAPEIQDFHIRALTNQDLWSVGYVLEKIANEKKITVLSHVATLLKVADPNKRISLATAKKFLQIELNKIIFKDVPLIEILFTPAELESTLSLEILIAKKLIAAIIEDTSYHFEILWENVRNKIPPNLSLCRILEYTDEYGHTVMDYAKIRTVPNLDSVLTCYEHTLESELLETNKKDILLQIREWEANATTSDPDRAIALKFLKENIQHETNLLSLNQSLERFRELDVFINECKQANLQANYAEAYQLFLKKELSAQDIIIAKLKPTLKKKSASILFESKKESKSEDDYHSKPIYYLAEVNYSFKAIQELRRGPLRVMINQINYDTQSSSKEELLEKMASKKNPALNRIIFEVYPNGNKIGEHNVRRVYPLAMDFKDAPNDVFFTAGIPNQLFKLENLLSEEYKKGVNAFNRKKK